ncbi:hypothetical protein KC909_04750, partial [Candidatus Dojkabacteria bacterium]|nr:hypothetical protein [Candidatus Dojkabacteria bacterium]
VTLCSDTGLTPSRGGSCPMKSSVLNKESIIDVDNRGSVTICNFTGKIPTNLDTARWNGDTTEYQFIQYALPLQQYQSAYNRLLTSLYPKTLTSDPGKEICAAPTEDNAGYSSNEPVISVSSPANGTQIKRGSSINVKGIVDALHLSADIRFDVIIRVGGSDYYISETTTPFASNIDTDITIPADETLGTTQLSIVLSGDSSSYSKSINVEIID